MFWPEKERKEKPHALDDKDPVPAHGFLLSAPRHIFSLCKSFHTPEFPTMVFAGEE
jgi:hypothetical protein